MASKTDFMASRRPPPGAQAIRVLLVDDSLLTLEMYGRYLRFAGMEVQTARDGREAIEKAFENPPDLIVMDISMPILEGDEAALALKYDGRTRDIPIIALTAFGGLARSKARSDVFDGFYHKPLLPKQLVDVIRSQVEHSRKATPRSRNL